MKTLVLATANGHKVRELKFLLKPLSSALDIYHLNQFPGYRALQETGITFEDNAILKATHAAKQLKQYVLADDSGLIVPALGGKPGIYSARYAGLNATDAENRKKLLQDMKSFDGVLRSAYFECVLVLASPEGQFQCARGVTEGEISFMERGRLGFGYDSLFIKHGYQKTFAELDEDVKSKISHRAKAMEKMKVHLENFLNV